MPTASGPTGNTCRCVSTNPLIGPSIRLHRHLRYGRTADLSVLDTRQFRDDQTGTGGWLPLDSTSLDPSRTITGDEQERWLLDTLGRSLSRWNVVAQQVAMAQLDRKTGPELELPMDTWNGYAASRDRVLSGVAIAGCATSSY